MLTQIIIIGGEKLPVLVNMQIYVDTMVCWSVGYDNMHVSFLSSLSLTLSNTHMQEDSRWAVAK